MNINSALDLVYIKQLVPDEARPIASIRMMFRCIFYLNPCTKTKVKQERELRRHDDASRFQILWSGPLTACRSVQCPDGCPVTHVMRGYVAYV